MRGKTGFMSFKLHISKVYDLVEWSFNEVVMHKMGLGEKWI